MPPAALAVIAAVVEEHRYAEPGHLVRLIAAELRREGWQISAPGAGRPTKVAVPAPEPAGAPEAA
jgi:hypothetical protein